MLLIIKNQWINLKNVMINTEIKSFIPYFLIPSESEGTEVEPVLEGTRLKSKPITYL